MADPRVPRRLDESVLPGYLAYGYAPSPRTFYEGIQSLPPGHVLSFMPGGEPVVERYWSLPVLHRVEQRSFADMAVELRRLLRDAVAKRLLADVPLGAFLSGGVDSSAVVGLMAEQMGEPVRTFSMGFDEVAFDERPWARLVARRFGTVHSEHVVRADAAVLLEEVLQGCDQPFADSSALPTYLLAQVTRRDVTVALSGDGGDELFAGYERFGAGLALARVPGSLAGGVSGLLARRRAPERLIRAVDAARGGLPEAYDRLVMVTPPELVDELLRSDDADVLRMYDDVWSASSGMPSLLRLLHRNISTYLLDDLLVKVDRMSMLHGLEVRSPLLDPALLHFSMSVPPTAHVRGRQTKRLLKAAVADLLPREVLDRPKKGFGVPMDRWMREDLASTVRDQLLSPSTRVLAYLERTTLERLVHEHVTGQRSHGQRLWSLLMLERFLRDRW